MFTRGVHFISTHHGPSRQSAAEQLRDRHRLLYSPPCSTPMAHLFSDATGCTGSTQPHHACSSKLPTVDNRPSSFTTSYLIIGAHCSTIVQRKTSLRAPAFHGLPSPRFARPPGRNWTPFRTWSPCPPAPRPEPGRPRQPRAHRPLPLALPNRPLASNPGTNLRSTGSTQLPRS